MSRRLPVTLSGLPLALALWAAACGNPPAVREVIVSGTEYALVSPDTLSAGPVRFLFRNTGHMAHEVGIGRVKAGIPLDSVLRMELRGDDIERVYDAGEGLLYADVGDVVEAALHVELLSGRDYVLICTLPDSAGKAHSMRGMVRGLRVTKSSTSSEAKDRRSR